MGAVRAETAGFDKTSHEYERGRPGYPSEAVEHIVAVANLAPGDCVVDLAAGTGKLTRELVAHDLDVIAVEPLDEMRARLVEQVPEADTRYGTAQATDLGDGVAKAVTIAQAFHWFAEEEVLGELQRVLQPEGTLVLIWNKRDLADHAQAEISRLTAPYVGDAPSYGSGRWEEVMGATRRFSKVGEESFPFRQSLDRDGLRDRVGSTSYIANLPDEERLPLLDQIDQLAPSFGTIDLPYRTWVYAYRRLS